MYIGILDQDILLFPKDFRPSLEVMKISAYHKKKGDVVEFSLTFENSDKYDIFYVSRDLLTQKDFPSEYMLQDNLVWVGRGFTGKYIRLKDEIEQSEPDRTFYTTFIQTHKKMFKRKILTTITNKILNPSYVILRITDGDDLLLDYKKLTYKNEKIILFDFDFFDSCHAIDILNYLHSRGNQVFILNPCFVRNLELFHQIGGRIKSIDAAYAGVYYVANELISTTSILKHIDDFNHGCGLYMFWDEREKVSRKNIITMLNLYLLGVSKGKKISMRVQPLTARVEDNLVPEGTYKEILCSMNDIFLHCGPNSNYSMLDLLQKKKSKIALARLNKLIHKDRNLYIMLNLNLLQVHKNGRWSPKL